MASTEKRTVSLPAEHTAFIDDLVASGSYASAILGQNATPEAVAAMEEKLGLNEPALWRYILWLGAAATGDLGQSFAGRPVMTVLGPRLLNTITLAARGGCSGL